MARLPGDVLNFLEIAGELADKQEVKAYLIGGMVRDLFLGLENRDLDIVLAPGPEAPELNPDLERRKEAHPPGLGNRGQVSNPELEKERKRGIYWKTISGNWLMSFRQNIAIIVSSELAISSYRQA